MKSNEFSVVSCFVDQQETRSSLFGVWACCARHLVLELTKTHRSKAFLSTSLVLDPATTYPWLPRTIGAIGSPTVASFVSTSSSTGIHGDRPPPDRALGRGMDSGGARHGLREQQLCQGVDFGAPGRGWENRSRGHLIRGILWNCLKGSIKYINKMFEIS